MQPRYDHVPTAEPAEDEPKNDVAVELGSTASSSSSGSSGDSSDHNGDGGDGSSGSSSGLLSFAKSGGGATYASRGLMAVPILCVRFVYLCWLLVTEPLRRRGRRVGARWPAIYAQLEEFQVLVPMFLRPAGGGAGAPTRRMHPTAWLDGLRGIAAFLVVWHHASLLWFEWHIHNGYGSADGERWLIQLPWVRLLIAGPPHVCVFFVISGYALSYKPLRLSRQGRYGEAGEAIHSSVFRRHTRLFLMPVLLTFLAALMGYAGLFGSNSNWKNVAIASRIPPRGDGTFFGQIGDWLHAIIGLVNPLSGDLSRGNRFFYDPNLWTLPVEFDCSLMLFLAQAAFNRFRPLVRIAFMLAVATFAMAYIHWQAFLFLAGMIICDLHFEFDGIGGAPAAAPAAAPPAAPAPEALRGEESAAELSEMGPSAGILAASTAAPARGWATAYYNRVAGSQRLATARRNGLFGVLSFVACLYLLSMPDAGRGSANTPGYKTLVSWAPAYHKEHNKLDWFFFPLGAVFLVFTIDRTPLLQRIFTHGVSQYLGKISYSLYLVHGPLIWSIGHWAARKGIAVTGAGSQWQYGLGIAFSAMVTWSFAIFFADLATRTIDAKSVALGRIVYERFAQKDPQAPRS